MSSGIPAKTRADSPSPEDAVPHADMPALATALNGLCFREFVSVSLALALVTVVAASFGLDMAIARLCHADGRWGGGDWRLGETLYQYGRTWKQPALFLAIGGLLFALLSFRFTAWRKHLKAALFFPLLLALGPGLVVNATLKDHWGRPRPCQVAEFGGTHGFRQPWEPEFRISYAEKLPSFPSGHASMAFFMMAPWFVLRSRRPRAAFLWLIGGLAFGALVGAGRVTQGGHFPSDILWSGGAVYLSGLLLARLMRLDTARAAEPSSLRKVATV